MGLRPTIYRAAVSVLTKRQHYKVGYYGAIANKQYEYDHRQDQGLFLDKKFMERKLDVMKMPTRSTESLQENMRDRLLWRYSVKNRLRRCKAGVSCAHRKAGKIIGAV